MIWRKRIEEALPRGARPFELEVLSHV